MHPGMCYPSENTHSGAAMGTPTGRLWILCNGEGSLGLMSRGQYQNFTPWKTMSQVFQLPRPELSVRPGVWTMCRSEL